MDLRLHILIVGRLHLLHSLVVHRLHMGLRRILVQRLGVVGSHSVRTRWLSNGMTSVGSSNRLHHMVGHWLDGMSCDNWLDHTADLLGLVILLDVGWWLLLDVGHSASSSGRLLFLPVAVVNEGSNDGSGHDASNDDAHKEASIQSDVLFSGVEISLVNESSDRVVIVDGGHVAIDSCSVGGWDDTGSRDDCGGEAEATSAPVVDAGEEIVPRGNAVQFVELNDWLTSSLTVGATGAGHSIGISGGHLATIATVECGVCGVADEVVGDGESSAEGGTGSKECIAEILLAIVDSTDASESSEGGALAAVDSTGALSTVEDYLVVSEGRDHEEDKEHYLHFVI